MNPSKAERLQEFLRRLESLALAATLEEARAQIDCTLTQVEDELTDIPADPSKWRTDGRLYPPQSDNSYDMPGFPEVTRFRTLAHHLFLGSNGAIEIRAVEDESGEPADSPRNGRLLYAKDGADGKGVWKV